MGSLGRKKKSSTSTSTGTGTTSTTPSTTGTPGTTTTLPATKKLEYADDKVQHMPLLDSASALRAAQKLQRQLQARTGRGSTRLVSDAGTRPYVASLLGNVT